MATALQVCFGTISKGARSVLGGRPKRMANFFENIFGTATKSPIAELVVSSTDPLLMGPDWSANLEVPIGRTCESMR